MEILNIFSLENSKLLEGRCSANWFTAVRLSPVPSSFDYQLSSPFFGDWLGCHMAVSLLWTLYRCPVDILLQLHRPLWSQLQLKPWNLHRKPCTSFRRLHFNHHKLQWPLNDSTAVTPHSPALPPTIPTQAVGGMGGNTSGDWAKKPVIGRKEAVLMWSLCLVELKAVHMPAIPRLLFWLYRQPAS